MGSRSESEVRKPPVGAVLKLHPQGVRGTCGWCGNPCEDKTPGRGWLKWFHDACAWEMGIIERPEQARRAVLERDKGICCDCGENWSEMSAFRPAYPVAPHWVDFGASPDLDRCSPGPKPGTWCQISEVCFDWSAPQKKRWFAPYVKLTVISLWHVDHKVPLWKVRDMPDLQRLEYFKLPNLITRCHRCHGFKTSKEAGARSKFNDQGDPKPEKPKRPWPEGRKLQGRGFPKSRTGLWSRKMRK